MTTGAPAVRVRDASLSPFAGPVHVTLSRFPAAAALAALLPDRVDLTGERLTTVTTPDGLVTAAEEAFGSPFAEALRSTLTAAIAGWHAGAPDLPTPAGTLPCASRPAVMGVLNVTPDSFSDGGRWFRPDDHPRVAVEHGERLAAEGADVIDVGGESTRPGADPVPADEELRRVLPVVEALAAAGHIVSIDTSKADVARAAIGAGAALVNDVSGGTFDPELLGTVGELGVPYVLMHIRGTPRTMQHEPTYGDVVGDVFDRLAAGLERCADAGIDPGRVVVDPGIGFGKTAEHNLELLRHLRDLTSLGRPVLVGASRKSFLGQLLDGAPEDDRLEGSLAAAALAVDHGAAIVRAHDVAATVRVLAVADALRGPRGGT